MVVPDDPLLETLAAVPQRSLLRGLGWATLDQAISSCTNFGIAVVAARELSREGFGAFGLAMALSIVTLGVSRALVTEPLLSRPELAAGDLRAPAFGAATGAMAALGVAAAAVVLAAGALLGDGVGRALLALAVGLPGLAVQDAVRFCFLSQNRGRDAAVNDTVWFVVQGPVLVALAAWTAWSTVSILLTWGGSALAAAIVGLWQARVLPRPADGVRWVLRQRDLGARYCLEFVIANGAGQLALVGLGAMSGLAALGAVRGAQTFFGPLFILFAGILLAVVPSASRLKDDPVRMRRLIVLISGSVCVAATAWTIVGLAIPRSVGEGFFGDTWAPIRQVMIPVGLTLVASGVAGGPFAGLRALAAAREGLRARLLTVPFMVGLPLAGAALADAEGFAYGLLGATSIMAAVYWRQFAVASGRR